MDTDQVKKKIIIVEDEPDANQIFVDILEGAGYDARGASDGVKALEMLASQGPFDLVLLDIVMPNKDGIETLTEIKKNPDLYGNMDVVMLTNIAGDLAVDKAMGLGAKGYMLKSEAEPADLISVVEQYLQG